MDFTELLNRLRRGDPEAFTAFITEYAPLLEHAARYRFPGSPPDFHKDVTHEVFISLARLIKGGQLPEFSTLRDWQRWLCKVACRRAVDVHRQNKRFPQPLKEADSIPTSEGSAEAFVERHERVLAVNAAIVDLPERERQVVCAHYFDGVSVAEVARALGIPVNTVKSDLHRARGKIARALGLRFDSEA